MSTSPGGFVYRSPGLAPRGTGRNMRTITTTTNHTSGVINFMEQDLKDVIAKTVAGHTSEFMKSLLFDEASFSKGKPIVYKRIQEMNRKRTVSFSDGYWAKIDISDSDHVSYKVFNSGWLAKTFNKIGFRKVLGNGWDSVKKRDTIEATLGATYMAIDEAIEEDLRKMEHNHFLKEMIKTDPENLKAIAQLDMLDKGDGPGTEQLSTAGQVSSAGSGVAFATPGQNITVSGSGTYSKIDSSKPAVLQTAPISFSGGGAGATLLQFEGEDAIKMDPDGSVSFGHKMAQAIKATVEDTTTEKGESNGS